MTGRSSRPPSSSTRTEMQGTATTPRVSSPVSSSRRHGSPQEVAIRSLLSVWKLEKAWTVVSALLVVMLLGLWHRDWL